MARRVTLLRAATTGLLGAALALAGCAVPGGEAVPPAAAPPTTQAPAGSEALAALAGLEVRGRAPMTGYDRDRFGPAWLDADRNGCDQRNDVLARDLRDVTEENCRVLTGTLHDPYTDERIAYAYGDATLVDVDHVVSLGNAWASGAGRWPVRRRAALATDPLNLLAVDASANRQKGDGDAATWLPPHRAYRCAYVARQVAVKAKFALSVTAAERDAVARVLDGCPGQRLPADPGAPVEVDHDLTDPADASPTVGPDGAFADCAAARAAGAAPLRRGEPGYGPGLDGDGDGVACE